LRARHALTIIGDCGLGFEGLLFTHSQRLILQVC